MHRLSASYKSVNKYRFTIVHVYLPLKLAFLFKCLKFKLSCFSMQQLDFLITWMQYNKCLNTGSTNTNTMYRLINYEATAKRLIGQDLSCTYRPSTFNT